MTIKPMKRGPKRIGKHITAQKTSRRWELAHPMVRLSMLTGPGRMEYDEEIRYQNSTWNGLSTIVQSYLEEYYEDLKPNKKRRYY